MFNKKIEVSADKITLSLYENGNVEARGGKRTMIPKVKDLKKGYHAVYNDDTFDRRYELVPNETEVVGVYHEKNYRQRKKIRKKALEALVRNNFQHGNSLFITLHFDSSRFSGDAPVEEENILALPEGWIHADVEPNLVELYDSIFSSESKETVTKPEVKITNEGYQNIDICYAEFKKFIQRMNYRYQDFKYVAVLNRQKDTGNWHYHMICNLRYIKFDELKELWGQGGVYIGRITSKVGLERTLNYCKNNMIFASKSLKNEKGYYASRGLNRNKVFRSWKGNEKTELEKYIQITKQAELAGVKPEKRVTEHPYMGEDREDEIFVRRVERVCRVKYFTYPIDSSGDFTMTLAKKKKRK